VGGEAIEFGDDAVLGPEEVDGEVADGRVGSRRGEPRSLDENVELLLGLQAVALAGGFGVNELA